MKDYATAKYTAILSDLHLCEAEPVHPKFPLWKKYKTRQFFFDENFRSFLDRLCSMADGGEIELVLNGDIFDFDSVLARPEDPPYRVSWFERTRGLEPEEEKSLFKIEVILRDHTVFVEALREFILRGHRVVFVIGNHDIELHWPAVQNKIFEILNLSEPFRASVRFCEWFYISNGDTLIEHGNQYDPYCQCIDPINPFVLQYNKVEIRLPLGNITSRYLINVMGFFNPHVDSGYIMTLPEYVRFFVKYIARAQPLLIWTWFWGSTLTLAKSFSDSLLPAIKDPLSMEDRIDAIASRANATPRMVRELRELFVAPAARQPLIVAQELWLDRAFILLIGLLVLFQIFLFIKQVYDISFFWMFIPILLLVPFFLFYSRSIRSNVVHYKEPQDDILEFSAGITKVRRVVYGHTHVPRHEVIGSVEHLNSGSWSPGFLDVECTQPIGHKTFVWILPSAEGGREAKLLEVTETGEIDYHRRSAARRKARR